VLDMKSGYHQVEILEQHKERTAFSVGPLGFFEFNRMSFGLTNAPASYQRVIHRWRYPPVSVFESSLLPCRYGILLSLCVLSHDIPY
jgi:hypothetical protein